MHDFLLTVCPAFLWVFTVCHLAFIALFVVNFKKSKKIAYLLCALVSFGLFYDALILSFGTFMKEGSVLQTLSQLRFVSHGALIPLLFAITAYALKMNKVWRISLLCVTGVLICLGVAEGFATVLECSTVGNVCRYMSSKELTPSWAAGISSLLSYGAVAPLIIGGIYAWIKEKSPCFFLSGFLMFAFSALGPATGNFDLIFFISMFGEFCMMLFLYLFLKKVYR